MSSTKILNPIKLVDPKQNRNLRERTPLKQTKLNYKQLGSGNQYDDLLETDDEDDFQISPKRYRKTGSSKKQDNSDDDFENILKKRKQTQNRIKSNKQKEATRIYDNQIINLIGWRNDIKIQKPCNDKKLAQSIQVSNIAKIDLGEYVKDLQALFININWKNETNKNGIGFDEFQQLNLENSKIMKNGIIFIWVDKEIMGDLMKYMDKMKFNYIENFTIIHLSLKACLKFYEQKAPEPKTNGTILQYFQKATQYIKNNFQKEKSTEKQDKEDKEKPKIPNSVQDQKQLIQSNLSKLTSIQIDDLIMKNPSEYFLKSKRILMMFRRITSKESYLELRHQRTSDVVFDLTDNKDPDNLDNKSMEYVYGMIETLLPKAKLDGPNSKASTQNFKMCELYAQHQIPRQNWIGFYQ